MAVPLKTLVLGGARSGKSRHAEALVLEAAAAGGARPVYLATFRPWNDDPDAEMDERIRLHRQRRGDAWSTEEAPVALPEALAAHAGTPVLVDCLTLWLTNLILDEADLEAAFAAFERVLRARAAPVVLVANEVGMSLVPETSLGRRFRDQAGLLNQRVAAICDRVVFVAAGLPLYLKRE